MERPQEQARDEGSVNSKPSAMDKNGPPGGNRPFELNKRSASVSGSSASDEGGPTSTTTSETSEKDTSDHKNDRPAAAAAVTKPKKKSKKSKSRSNVLAECTYKDYSQVPPEPVSTNETLAGELASKKNVPAKEPTFPVKLHMILSNPSLESIVSWLPHGRSWRILNQREFEEKVIPLYFRHGRFSSFTRQVSGWGFNRITAGCDFNSYYHELFLRGKPHLCHMMKRLTAKDTAERREIKKSGQAEPLPDFYLMDRTNPLPQNSPKDAQPLPKNLLQSEALPGQSNFSPPGGPMVQNNPSQQQMNEINQLRLLQNTISGQHTQPNANANNSQVAMQPPSNNAPAPNILGLLSTLISSGQLQPQQVIAILAALMSSQQAPAPQQQQQITSDGQAFTQQAFNMPMTAVPAPIASAPAFNFQPQVQQAPAPAIPAQSNNSNMNLLAQLLQAQQQPRSQPGQQMQQQQQQNPLASLFQQAQQQQPFQPQSPPQRVQQQPPPPPQQTRENNTTGQTIANFLHDRSQQQEQKQQQEQQQLQEQQQQAAAPPPPSNCNPLANLFQQAQLQPNGMPDLAALLFSQGRTSGN